MFSFWPLLRQSGAVLRYFVSSFRLSNCLDHILAHYSFNDHPFKGFICYPIIFTIFLRARQPLGVQYLPGEFS